MPNESITIDLIRDIFVKDEWYKDKQIIIEREKSENAKINKLLQNASKNGNSNGRPDFIIQYVNNPNLLIAIECKADIKKHESIEKTNYKDYAVDGVKLYSSFLSKEFDIISIAISGNNKNNLKISHFLQLKGTTKYESIFANQLLNFENYLNSYLKDNRKFNQDFFELLNYSKNLNDKLHTLKIPEAQRSLLISGSLIALKNKSFYAGYKIETSVEGLINNFLNAIKTELTNVGNKHIEEIITTYSFIKTHTILSKQEGILKSIIIEIDEKINSFIKNYQYFDTLGQFYIEFLRYTNNDKGLGIVLTPPHITQLFCEIADINKNSVVLDNCTGTGGFLISAMQKMVKDTFGDENKEKTIKKEQIIGIEYQHDIFTLLCSNMFIHGDGRSNLFKGSCFDEKIKQEVMKFKPNVGFLNPPYKDSKADIEEFEFVLNNLSFLEKGSYCLAIIPMSCALAQNGNRLILKEKLLKEHTLEAVFSMPTELFVNSNVGVNTCIMVFKAKEKHPENYKSYFGYWKDDGFTKRKTNGRTDYNGTWENIKKEWIKNFKNKDEIAGHSIKKVVKANDEWCVEAYMETDYSKLNKEDFEMVLKKYTSYKIINGK